MSSRIPVIDVTDLYHPHQDCGDNIDLMAPYAMPEIELRAVILDCTQRFREANADHPNPHYRDTLGPRDPGFIPVHQLNYIFNRHVPAAVGPFTAMRHVHDRFDDVPAFQQQGIELLLRTLRESDVPVTICVFSSARAVAGAFNRDPELFHDKVQRIHLSAGSFPAGYLEWNVMLDVHAFVCLLRSGVPIDLYPCATDVGPFSLGERNTYWHMPDLSWMARLEPRLRRYLGFALQRCVRMDYLRAMDEDWPKLHAPEAFCGVQGAHHHWWETAIWLGVTGRQLVRRADGTHRILLAHEIAPGDEPLTGGCREASVVVQDDGQIEVAEGVSSRSTGIRLYQRSDPTMQQQALCEAVPAWYQGFAPDA